ncbi:hypothetical protein CRM22_005541 [Opisthorchis felineus]|uniref:Uncharacterized protein n=1 Tax=Opisthorchis felineus TaxID=147828 RepID=A0A4S2LQR4_OPIFE|nr:hypothetical protein CRM22_005541 [Opisthorchis felineus]
MSLSPPAGPGPFKKYSALLLLTPQPAQNSCSKDLADGTKALTHRVTIHKVACSSPQAPESVRQLRRLSQKYAENISPAQAEASSGTKDIITRGLHFTLENPKQIAISFRMLGCPSSSSDQKSPLIILEKPICHTSATRLSHNSSAPNTESNSGHQLQYGCCLSGRLSSHLPPKPRHVKLFFRSTKSFSPIPGEGTNSNTTIECLFHVPDLSTTYRKGHLSSKPVGASQHSQPSS